MKTLFTVLFLALVISVSAGNSKETATNNKKSTTTSTVIRGEIIDSVSKESLAGVRVVIGNTGIVTYTDFDGKFTVELHDNNEKKEIKISYISYEEAEVSINEKENNIIEISPIN